MAAALLKEEGHEVTGLSLRLFEHRGGAAHTACCSLDAIRDAERSCGIIGIAHESLDARAAFMCRVVEPFIDGYTRGITPNPCILCNMHVKFPMLLSYAKSIGADAIATGHYAIRTEANGRAGLRMGADRTKDQTYFLYGLRKEELSALMLPLGAMGKDEVRGIAKRMGLPVFNRPESQEICFVQQDGYAGLVREISPGSPAGGPIVHMDGRQMGEHAGIHAYTIGQRKGLGISNPDPLYVIKIDASTNIVTVGPREAVMKRDVSAYRLNMIIDRSGEFRTSVKIRSTMKAEPATVRIEGDSASITFDEQQFAPAPGQAAVFYDDDLLIGGGEIIN